MQSENNISIDKIEVKYWRTGKAKLLEKRNKRIRPLLDDKIILGWNALMNTACSKAFAATGNEEYRQLAIDNMQFLLEKFASDKPDEFYHTWKNDKAKFPAFLDDYAFLIQALIHLQEITGDTEWLFKAKAITESVIENFSEPDTGFFFYTRADQEDVIVRKKEVYDGAVPSGNSVMAYIISAFHYFDKAEWKQRSFRNGNVSGPGITRYPTSFGVGIVCCWK